MDIPVWAALLVWALFLAFLAGFAVLVAKVVLYLARFVKRRARPAARESS